MPFEIGHPYAGKARVIEAELRKITVQDIAQGDGRSKIRKALQAQLDQAANGSLPALDWWVTRLEGKPRGDEADKSQLIQVVINGYADVQARIVDNSTVVADDGGAGVVGGLLSDGGGGSREPVDGLSIPKDSLSISKLTDAAPIKSVSESSESTPRGIESALESEVVPSTTGG